MSVLGVLEKLRRKKSEAVADVWLQYRQDVLGPLAAGQEIDLDLVESMLEQLGKSEHDLQRDHAGLQKRISVREQIRAAESNAKRLATLEREIQRLDEEFARKRSEFENAMKPLLSQRSALSSGAAVMTLENELIQTVQNPKLRQAIAENTEKKRAIAPRIDELRIELHRNSDGGRPTIRWKVDSVKDQIAKLSSSEKGPVQQIADNLLKYAVGDKRDSEKQTQLASLRVQLERLEQQESRMAAELDELERQQAVLLDEERRLYRECLEP